MDLDAEMERLSREARQKLEAERGAERPAVEEPTSDVDVEVLAEARRLAARPEGAMSLGGKVVAILAGLVVAWVLWSYVVAPLLALAVLIAIVAGIIWIVMKLMGDDEEEDDKTTT